MPSPSRSTRRPKLRLRPGSLLILVGLLLAVALPLIASAEHQRDAAAPARQALGVGAAIIRGRAPARFDTSTRKLSAASRGNITPQALGCANATTPINYGQTISGADIKLAPGDCTNPIDGTLYDAYTFDGVAGQQIVIDMTSTDFDDYLYLMRPGETTLDPATTIQDDDSGGGTNARITLTLSSSGTYTILADSYYNGITPAGTGSYALTVTQVCTYTLPNASRTVGSHGGTFSDAYTTQAACPAPALTSNNAFITAGSATVPDTNGSGTFGYTVAPNTGAQRAGTLTVADQTFTVQQSAFLPGTLQLNSSAYTVNEGAGSVSINVTRTGGSDGAISVQYATANDVNGAHPATGGSDYTSQSGTLNFADGDAQQKTISIPITDDAEVEGDETFIVSLSNVTGGATLGSPSSATVTINDNDTCTYAINPTSHTSPAAGDSGSVTVTAPVGCSWTTSSVPSWITINGTSGSGSGNGTVSYTVLANPNSATRTAALTIAGQTFNVTQSGVSCAFTLSSAGQSFNSTGGTGSVGVTANAPDCAWTATSNNSDWITINSGASGTGNGLVNFTVGANTSSIARTGTLTIAGQTFTVTQSGVSCTYSITPPTSQSFASGGGTNSVIVTTNASDCSWTAASNDGWITITSGTPGSGSGTLNYSVAANSGAARTGTLTVAGQKFTVTQAAGPGVLQFSSSAYAISEDGGNVVLTVTRTVAAGGMVSVSYTTGNGTATGGADYGAQTGTLNFNEGVTSQTMTIPILEDQIVEGDETFTVTLSNATNGATLGSPATATVTISDDDTCSYTLPNASRAVGSSGGTFSDAYKTLVGCAAPAVTSNNTAFITAGAVSAPDANGNGTFAYTVAPNVGAQRVGTLTIAGQTFTVTQAFATYQISGHITDSSNNDPSGVTVTLSTVTPSSTTNVSTTTDSQGNYSFANLAAGGDYIVTPSKANYSFTDESLTFSNLRFNNLLGDQTANFIGTPHSVTLSGRVTVRGAGLGNVTIMLSDSVSGVTTTNDQGYYSFAVAPNKKYTVTPSRTHYTFNPTSLTFNPLTTDATAADFAATLNTHNISGRITDGAGTPLIGVNVNLSGAQTTATTTNASGDYSFLNLPAGGTYTVTPSLANYTFTPAPPTFTNLGSDQSANFTATLNTYTVSGRVMLSGSPLPGVTVTMSGGATGTSTTDDNGNYSFASVTGGLSVTLTPAKANYTFTPAQQTINIDGDRPNIDFVGTVVPSVLQFAQGQYQIAEDGVRVNVNITRTGDPSTAVTVDVRTIDNPAAVPCGDTTTLPGVAFARCDYATTVETLVFAANETQKTISVPIIDDSWVEPVETFQLALSNPTGGATIGAQGTTSVAIADNDVAGEANPINSTDFFVRMQYLDFLSREPEAGQPWSAVLNNCAGNDPACDRISVSSNFFRSQEFQLKGLFVFHFYRVAFNRLPLYSEIVADMRAVTGSTTAELQAKKGAFTTAFAQRQEFKNLYDSLTNQQFVDTLMNRYALQSITTPDPSAPDGTTKITLTRADLFNRLTAATLTRAQVVRAIADSDQVGAAEFNPAFVAMQYFGYLRRDPETGGYNAWLQTINANPSDFRSMVNGFMNSLEYRARFGQP